MRKVALTAMFFGAWGLMACGDDGGGGDPDGGIVIFDAPEGEADAPDAVRCNPVENTGCDAGQKCSFLVVGEQMDGTPLGQTTCLPDGTIPKGGACEAGAPGEETGFDNCVGGLFCLRGQCTEVCGASPDTCPMGESACSLYNGIFVDVDETLVGLCDALCDVFDVTTCPDGQGCYLNLGRGNATCAGIVVAGQQGEPCTFINSCDAGLGCILLAPDQSGNTCTNFCRTLDGTTADGQNCAAKLGGGAGAPACVQVNVFYGDTPDVPDEVGMCADCAIEAYAGLTACVEATGGMMP